jgi:glycosyltransferase involved in cell wall biosynthesis
MIDKETSKPLVVACIPALNEERSIGSVIVRTLKHVDRVIVCDDGSMDLTGDIAENMGAVVIRHEVNRGKGAALKSAFSHARDLKPDVVVMIDADEQHNPEDIPRLVEPILKNEADMVVGSRYVEGSSSDAPLYRRLGLIFINALSGRSNHSSVKDTQSGFRAFSARALEVVLKSESNGYGVETEQLALSQRYGLRVVEVPVKIDYKGLVRTSKKNPVSHGVELLGTVLKLVVEDRPLLILGVPGMLITLLGIFTGVYLLWYFNNTRYFSLPLALITLGTIIMGVLLVITSLLLYSITKLKLSECTSSTCV